MRRFTETIVLRVEPEVKAALERLAEAEQRSVGNLVRFMIVQRLQADGELEAPRVPSKKKR